MVINVWRTVSYANTYYIIHVYILNWSQMFSDTQKYVVTFTTSQSYIEVPGWRKGDIAFSFRTTGEKAILLYQPPIRNNYPSFMVALTSDYRLTFNFTLNTGANRELEVKSRRKLNNGEWQKIWIDYNDYHVRFMINTDFQTVDLEAEEEFGPFEGSMFIGGATAWVERLISLFYSVFIASLENRLINFLLFVSCNCSEHLKTSAVRQGLIGCFRGLVVNGEILDIHSYMSVHLSEIIKDCKPSCQPNKCQNGARCVELWSNFECVCENRWAHQGTFCETSKREIKQKKNCSRKNWYQQTSPRKIDLRIIEYRKMVSWKFFEIFDVSNFLRYRHFPNFLHFLNFLNGLIFFNFPNFLHFPFSSLLFFIVLFVKYCTLFGLRGNTTVAGFFFKSRLLWRVFLATVFFKSAGSTSHHSIDLKLCTSLLID